MRISQSDYPPKGKLKRKNVMHISINYINNSSMEDTVESYLSITATFRRKKVAVVERWLLEKGLKKRR